MLALSLFGSASLDGQAVDAEDAEDIGGGVVDEPSPVKVSLDTARGRYRETVTLTLSLRVDVPIKSLLLTLNFDESRLRARDVRFVRRPEGVVVRPTINNADSVLGAQDREGWIHLEIENSSDNSLIDVPQNRFEPLLEIDFFIRSDSRLGRTDILFSSVVNGEETLDNAVVIRVEADLDQRRPLAPEDAEGGWIEIIGEVGFFLRADVDLNCKREITDALVTLRYLFLGGREPPCLDAADSNDSGDLDVSDPIYTLDWMFGGGSNFPEPLRVSGPDPTLDRLDCLLGLPAEGCPSVDGNS